jgi:hypothetical protein
LYEYHGWFSLAETPAEIDDGNLATLLPGVQQILQRLVPPSTPVPSSASADLRWLNGQPHILVQGFANRPRGDDRILSELLGFLAAALPGSFGILYERDDERIAPPGPNAFRVRVLARGRVSERDDPFLSPCVPTIED